MYGITHIYNGIYVGGDPEFSADLETDIELIKTTIDMIVDVSGDRDGSDWSRVLGKTPHQMIQVRMHDDGKRSNSVEQFVKVLDEVLVVSAAFDIDPESAKVFLHCHMGVNRAPSTAMYLLMALYGMDPMEAFTLIREKRTCAGLAYASTAIQAAKGTLPKGWRDFEKAYWEHEPHVKSVNDFIRQTRAVERGHSWIDEKGIVHVTR